MTIEETKAKLHRKEVLRAAITLAIVGVIGLAALAAGLHFERERGPDAQPLLAKMGQALAEQQRFSFKLTGSGAVDGQAPGELGKLRSEEGLSLRGYVGAGELALRGVLGGERIEMRLVGERMAIRYRGRWYAGPAGTSAPVIPQAGRELAKALAPWFEPRSYAGERIGGKATWRIAGMIPPAEETPIVNPMIHLNSLLGDVSYALTVERRSGLPLRFEAGLHGKPSDWFVMPGMAGEMNRIDIDLRLDFLDWGKRKPVVLPATAAPLAEFAERLSAAEA